MRRIFLIGYMGSGKTTLGQAFARALGLEFIDLDWYIEERYHRSIADIFAERGEEGFRSIERSLLHEVGEFEDVVIATGGGTPCFFDNIDYMNSVGQTVFLDVSPAVLFRRLKVAKAKRPLVAGKTDTELQEFIRTALDRRLPFYRKAACPFNGEELESRKQIAASVARLKEALEQLPPAEEVRRP